MNFLVSKQYCNNYLIIRHIYYVHAYVTMCVPLFHDNGFISIYTTVYSCKRVGQLNNVTFYNFPFYVFFFIVSHQSITQSWTFKISCLQTKNALRACVTLDRKSYFNKKKTC
jgi:hypothetical protein